MKNTKLDSSIITIMDFSGVYPQQMFYRNKNHTWIDCKISSSDGYADDNAIARLQEKIENCSAQGIHFIDNGNHHYVSKLWLEKITRPFDLVVFDHHSDMQRPAFPLLSCGSWILDTFDQKKEINHVIILGLSNEQKASINEYTDKVSCIGEEKLCKAAELVNILDKDRAVYISIDKDVLSKNELLTTWDQGNMSLAEMKDLLEVIFANYEVLGMDVCGCPLSNAHEKDIHCDNTVNEMLIDIAAPYFYDKLE